MSDGIIDLTQYLRRSAEADEASGAFALWGADGERSRFALPLWRTIYLAQGDRGAIVSRETGGGRAKPFVVLDLAHDPARLDIPADSVPIKEDGEPPALHDRREHGLVIYLGVQDDRIWHLFVDGGRDRTGPLASSAREDILFLAGECAGLLFLRDFAEEAGEQET